MIIVSYYTHLGGDIFLQIMNIYMFIIFEWYEKGGVGMPKKLKDLYYIYIPFKRGLFTCLYILLMHIHH